MRYIGRLPNLGAMGRKRTAPVRQMPSRISHPQQGGAGKAVNRAYLQGTGRSFQPFERLHLLLQLLRREVIIMDSVRLIETTDKQRDMRLPTTGMQQITKLPCQAVYVFQQLRTLDRHNPHTVAGTPTMPLNVITLLGYQGFTEGIVGRR